MTAEPPDTIRANNPFEVHLPDMPDECVKIKINGLGGSLSRVFNDSNKYQIESAEANGITPLHTLADVWSQSPRLERLHTCEAYYLDNLTHSMPFLVSKAHELLTDIGMAFRDSLRSRRTLPREGNQRAAHTLAGEETASAQPQCRRHIGPSLRHYFRYLIPQVYM